MRAAQPKRAPRPTYEFWCGACGAWITTSTHDWRDHGDDYHDANASWQVRMDGVVYDDEEAACQALEDGEHPRVEGAVYRYEDGQLLDMHWVS